ncbi:MAG: SPFH domain-containing protein [Gracilibacteraceae bacterium]|jgi:regulator of protease activity HflC (stomatin/prohibitin superfamily)|nr:SPFH domain-containing protein [Gracilibacteraceae bacterium]
MTDRKNETHDAEKKAAAANGMAVMLLNIALLAASIAGFVFAISMLVGSHSPAGALILMLVCGLYWVVSIALFCGLKVLKPNEAYVFTLFGVYYGTLRGPGFFFVNPFVSATAPERHVPEAEISAAKSEVKLNMQSGSRKKISLKAMTLSNEKQKINDMLGNPIEIGIVVIWRVVNTARAVFNVDDYPEFLSMQCDSALRGIVRMYPYDNQDMEDETSLRGSSEVISTRLREAIQAKVDAAGLEITEARITHLAYAPEIAAAMLQRQQATAIIDARKIIVDGAVGMVELALAKLSENGVVDLDEERKAAMVSNLLVVLCGNKDAQPVVNSGSLY